jgi:hypothetical protein
VERVTGIGGIFLRSTRPNELRRWYAEDAPHESGNGRFGWATDPDGNRIELWQPAPGQ